MLEVQEYLRSGKTLENLENEFAVSASHHPILPICILNYCQIDSPKMETIVRECRSLILERDSWNIVSRAFSRFYNLGEALEITTKFDWKNYRCYTKEDGSLTHLFHYGDSWHMATRSTFGHLKMTEQPFTWSELYWSTFKRKDILGELDKDCSYICELCSPYNQVVVQHEKPKLVLLDIIHKDCDTIFNGGEIDRHNKYVDNVAEFLGLERPAYHKFTTENPEDIKAFVNSLDNQQEGLVLQDWTGMRLKIKNAAYLALSALSNNGTFFYKNLYDLVIKGETEEICVYFPLARDKCEKLENLISVTKKRIYEVWAEIHHLEVQKDFALALAERKVPLGWVLFEARRHNLSLDEVFKLPRYYEKIKKGILELI